MVFPPPHGREYGGEKILHHGHRPAGRRRDRAGPDRFTLQAKCDLRKDHPAHFVDQDRGQRREVPGWPESRGHWPAASQRRHRRHQDPRGVAEPERSRHLRLYTEIFLGHPAKKREVYLKGSPILDVANVKKPVLVLHGLLDDVVPPEASEEWVEALKANGKSYEYKTYPDEPHGFLRRKNQLDVFERVECFLDWYLMV